MEGQKAMIKQELYDKALAEHDLIKSEFEKIKQDQELER